MIAIRHHDQFTSPGSTVVKIGDSTFFNAAGLYNPAVGRVNPTGLKKRKKKQATPGAGGNEESDEELAEEIVAANRNNRTRHSDVTKFHDKGFVGMVHNIAKSAALHGGCNTVSAV